jgi:predicted NACHT family NTPase
MPEPEKIRVFISSTMRELQDVRESVERGLQKKGIQAWVYESHSIARPVSVLESSLSAVDTADVYIGLFWQQYGSVTVEEFRRARQVKKPCLIYIRERDAKRDSALDEFLHEHVLDVAKEVTFGYFTSSYLLGQQVANDVLTWLVRRYRELMHDISGLRHSPEHVLRVELDRLQYASRQPLGSPLEYLAWQARAWFSILGYSFETHELMAPGYFQWIIRVPVRRGFDRILVRGVEGEAESGDVAQLRDAVFSMRVDEGWLIASHRKSQAARDALLQLGSRNLFCYTFDELLDERTDFTHYLAWLENEVKQKGIDRLYIPLAATKEEFHPQTGLKIGRSRYGSENGWLDGYIDRWLDDPAKEHISILGEFGTGKTWFTLHYAWLALERYREAKARGMRRPRLPLVVALRDYAKAVNVESLFSEFFFADTKYRSQAILPLNNSIEWGSCS